jgi:hypothetical protein
MARVEYSEYIMWHETTRYSPTVGEAPPTGYPASEGGKDGVGSSAFGFCLEEFGGTMARCIQARRYACTPVEGDSRKTGSYYASAEGATRQRASRGAVGGRILDRPVDAEADCGGHQETISYRVSSESCMAFAAKPWVELPKAGATCLATQRTGDSSLETGPLVGDKKKPPDVVPTWCFWMKAVSCWSPMSNVHGHPGDRRRISTTGFVRTEYRPSPRSAFRPSPDERLSTSVFISAISRESILNTSFDICSNMCEDASSCYGIAEQSIVIGKCRRISDDTRGSKRSSFHRTHQSSILQNSSGVKRIQPFQTLRHVTSLTSISISGLRQPDYGGHSHCSDRASMRPICLGREPDSFLYLCETQ